MTKSKIENDNSVKYTPVDKNNIRPTDYLVANVNILEKQQKQ